MSDSGQGAAWDDNFRDAVAMIRAGIDEDTAGIGIVWRNCDQDAVMAVMVKLITEACADLATAGTVSWDRLVRWAQLAVNR
jgi:hypothetical protein